MRWRGGSNDCGGLSLVALPAADLERETGPVDQQAYTMTWGSSLRSLEQ